jgi:uncharacterized membrane protein
MGLLENLLGEENERSRNETAENVYVEKKVPKIPFRVSTSFLPLRLSAMKQNSVNLIVKLKNITDDPQLVSVDVSLPKGNLLGFDSTCINKAIEKKVGTMQAGATAEVSIPVFASNQTEAGDYELGLTAYAHYQDYSKVLASVKKRASLRVV